MSTGLPEFEFAVEEVPVPNEQEAKQEEAPAKEQEEQPQEEAQEQAVQQPVEDATFVETQDTEDTEEPEVDEETSEYYTGLLNFYKEEGLVNYEEDDFDGSPEKFAEIIKNQRELERQQLEESLVNAVPEFGQSIMEYLLAEGDNLTVDKMKEFLDLKEQSAVPEIDSEDKAKEYLRSKYSKIHNEKVTERLLETLEDDEALLETAKSEQEKEKEALAKAEKSRIEQSKEQRAKAEEQRKEFFNSLTEEIKSTGWKPELQQTVYNDIVNQGLRQKTQSIVQHPKALIKLAHYLSYYDPKSGDIDESAFEKAAGSKVTKTIKNSLEKSFGRSGAYGGRTPGTKKKTGKKVNYTFAD